MFLTKVISWYFYADPTIIQTCISPNGEYTAYMFERNSGATSGWVYHVSVQPSETKLGKGNGNVYISDSQPEKMEWIDNHTLYIHDYRSNRTTKRNKRIHDVTVLFHSFELEAQ